MQKTPRCRFQASLTVITGLVCLLSAAFGAELDPLTGQIFIHDPSTVIQDHGRYYVFGTHQGITVRSSSDLLEWRREPPVFSEPPAWTWRVTFNDHVDFWAPDVIHINDKFFVYYAVSSWGKQTSAIGLVTSPTLDPTATNYAWTDGGMVIQSTNGSDFNTIDPSVMQDRDGSLWLAFGSFWRGIYLTPLDARTGLRAGTNSPLYHLAWNDSIEASCLTRHRGYYYLFVNWGKCCQGTNSTYEVRVGRSRKITGPYLDKAGDDLVNGGGSVFLGTEGRFIGPGHIGVLSAGGKTWISYHTYDAHFNGRSRLYLRQLKWTWGGWPVAGQPIEAATPNPARRVRTRQTS
jgi:arabinan endo-1,5-alpha-L-arabinosidase